MKIISILTIIILIKEIYPQSKDFTIKFFVDELQSTQVSNEKILVDNNYEVEVQNLYYVMKILDNIVSSNWVKLQILLKADQIHRLNQTIYFQNENKNNLRIQYIDILSYPTIQLSSTSSSNSSMQWDERKLGKAILVLNQKNIFLSNTNLTSEQYIKSDVSIYFNNITFEINQPKIAGVEQMSLISISNSTSFTDCAIQNSVFYSFITLQGSLLIKSMIISDNVIFSSTPSNSNGIFLLSLNHLMIDGFRFINNTLFTNIFKDQDPDKIPNFLTMMSCNDVKIQNNNIERSIIFHSQNFLKMVLKNVLIQENIWVDSLILYSQITRKLRNYGLYHDIDIENLELTNNIFSSSQTISDNLNSLIIADNIYISHVYISKNKFQKTTLLQNQIQFNQGKSKISKSAISLLNLTLIKNVLEDYEKFILVGIMFCQTFHLNNFNFTLNTGLNTQNQPIFHIQNAQNLIIENIQELDNSQIGKFFISDVSYCKMLNWNINQTGIFKYGTQLIQLHLISVINFTNFIVTGILCEGDSLIYSSDNLFSTATSNRIGKIFMNNMSFTHNQIESSQQHHEIAQILIKTEQISIIKIQNSIFSDNIAQLQVDDLTEKVGATVLYIQAYKSNVTVDDSQFINNQVLSASSQNFGANVHIRAKFLDATNSSFNKNIMISNLASSNLETNQISGGGLTVRVTRFICSNCQFIGNLAYKGGGIFFNGVNELEFQCFQCTFIKNVAIKEGAAFMLSKNLERDNIVYLNKAVISENIAKTEGGIIFAQLNEALNFTLNNSNVSSNYAQIGRFILLKAGYMLITVQNTFFSDNITSQNVGGLFWLRSKRPETVIKLQNCKLQNLKISVNSNKGQILNLYQGQLIINKTTIKGLTWGSDDIIYLRNVHGLYILNSEISEIEIVQFQQSLISSSINVNLDFQFKQKFDCLINNSLFLDITTPSTRGAAIHISQNAVTNLSVQIDQSVFKENSAKQGGSIVVIYENEQNQPFSLVSITNSHFLSNSVTSQGGAIYVKGVNLHMYQSYFFNNLAQSGGALYFQSEIPTQRIINVTNCTFSQNRGSIEGGAISYSSYQAYFKDNELNNNIALVYGENYAGVPTQLGVILPYINDQINKDQLILPVNISAVKLFENESYFNIYEKLKNIAQTVSQGEVFKEQTMYYESLSQKNFYLYKLSNNQTFYSGFSNQLFQAPKLVLLDQHDQIFTDFLGTVAYLEAESSNCKVNNIDCKDQQKFVIQKGVSIKEENGYFIFKTIQIEKSPEKILQLKFKTVNFQVPEKKIQSNIQGQIEFYLEKCKRGEVYDFGSKNCKQCINGTYSFDPEKFTCKACPKQAICEGGDKVITKEGYWRKQKYSVDFNQCEYPESCKKNDECAEGYSGLTCQSCSQNYIKVADNHCEQCQNVIRYIIPLLLNFSIQKILIYLFVSTFFNKFDDLINQENYDFLKNPLEDFKYPIIIKNLINLYQFSCIFSIISMKLRITNLSFLTAPDYYTYLINILKCYDFETFVPFPFFTRYAGVVLLFTDVVFTTCFFVIILFRNKPQKLKYFFGTLSVNNYLLGPIMFKILIQSLSCRTIKDNKQFEKFMSIDSMYSCSFQNYDYFLNYGIILLLIIFLCFLKISVLIWRLSLVRSRQFDQNKFAYYGIYILDTKLEYFYFSVLKIFLLYWITFLVFVNQNAIISGMLTIASLGFFLSKIKSEHPHLTKDVERLDYYLLRSFTFSTFTLIFYKFNEEDNNHFISVLIALLSMQITLLYIFHIYKIITGIDIWKNIKTKILNFSGSVFTQFVKQNALRNNEIEMKDNNGDISQEKQIEAIESRNQKSKQVQEQVSDIQTNNYNQKIDNLRIDSKKEILNLNLV